MELRCLMRKIMRSVNNSELRKRIQKEVGANDWILVYLAEHKDRDVYQRDLEKAFDITRSTVSKNVDMLVDAGYIEKQPVPGDARLKKLVPTEKASEIMNSVKTGGKILEETLTRGLSENELCVLSGLLSRMSENLDAISEEQK